MNEDGDFEGEPTGALAKFLEHLHTNAMRHDADASDAISKILDYSGYEGMHASKLFEILKADETLGYAQDDKGNLSRDEVVRQSLEDAGFDGIIDRTVNEKFGTQRKVGKPMAGMKRSTVHYVVFRPEQVKSVYNDGSFNPHNPDIRHSPDAPKSEEEAYREYRQAFDRVYGKNTEHLSPQIKAQYLEELKAARKALIAVGGHPGREPRKSD